jgi:hypothetical protein
MVSEQLKSFKINFIDNKNYWKVGIFSILLAISFGGTDIMCLQFGEKIFGEKIGYGAGNMIYSTGFFIGSFFAQKLRDDKIHYKLAIASLLACLTFFLLSSFDQIFFAGPLFIFIFCLYGYLYIKQDLIWFNIIQKETASTGFAIKSILFMLTVAIGEIVYGFLGENDLFIRIPACILLVLISYNGFKARGNKIEIP